MTRKVRDQIGNEIALIGPVPEMVMGIADRQFRFQSRLNDLLQPCRPIEARIHVQGSRNSGDSGPDDTQSPGR